MVNNFISVNPKGFLNFGDYVQTEKQKVDDFELNGDLYKLRTHNVITRLEKNGSLLFEAVPGVKVEGLNVTERLVEFTACGFDDTKMTIELEPETEYKIIIAGDDIGITKSTLSGKISFSAELEDVCKMFRVEKV